MISIAAVNSGALVIGDTRTVYETDAVTIIGLIKNTSDGTAIFMAVHASTGETAPVSPRSLDPHSSGGFWLRLADHPESVELWATGILVGADPRRVQLYEPR